MASAGAVCAGGWFCACRAAVHQHQDLSLHVGAFGSQLVLGLMRFTPVEAILYPAAPASCSHVRQSRNACVVGPAASRPSNQIYRGHPSVRQRPWYPLPALGGCTPMARSKTPGGCLQCRPQDLALFCPVISRRKETLHLVVCLMWTGT